MRHCIEQFQVYYKSFHCLADHIWCLKDSISRSNQKGVKIRTSLTKHRQNLLKYSREQAEDYEIIHFVFANVNDGNLKFRLKEKLRNRMVLIFIHKTELAKILGLIEHFDYSKLFQLIQHQRENSDGSDIDEFWFFFLFILCIN